MNTTGKQWFILEGGNTSPVDGEHYVTEDKLWETLSCCGDGFKVYEIDFDNGGVSDITDQAFADFARSEHAPEKEDPRATEADWFHDQLLEITRSQVPA